MGDVVNSLVGAGLSIEYLHEFPFCAWKVVAFAEPVESMGEGRFYYGLPMRFPPLPLMFSIKATKPVA